jgi:hypothetical protein
LGVDDDFGALKFAAQTGDVAVELLDLPGRGVGLWPTPLWGERQLESIEE